MSYANNSRPYFVSYVYPGWHYSPYRPTVDEWDLLDSFSPYFEGHRPPARPVDGRYDDSRAETVIRQLSIAQKYGISAFSYFLYNLGDSLILSEPLLSAIDVAETDVPLSISATWCIRLPIADLPIPSVVPRDRKVQTVQNDDFRQLSPADKPLEMLTPADLEALLNEEERT